MSDTIPIPSAVPATTPAKPRSRWRLTDPGCRTELRLGILVVFAACFLWLWAGPLFCIRAWWVGIVLLAIGVPWQALESRRGRPGFPWKAGLAMLLMGGAMCFDLRYREQPGGSLLLHPVGPFLAGPGLWILLWWPATLRRRDEEPG